LGIAGGFWVGGGFVDSEGNIGVWGCDRCLGTWLNKPNLQQESAARLPTSGREFCGLDAPAGFTDRRLKRSNPAPCRVTVFCAFHDAQFSCYSRRLYALVDRWAALRIHSGNRTLRDAALPVRAKLSHRLDTLWRRIRIVRRIRGSIPARATCQVCDRAQVRGSGRCGNRRIFSW
jgi:hypothetical protein